MKLDSRVILLIEDNPSDVDLTVRAFEKAHIANEILIARNGEEALEILSAAAQSDTLPALILLDLKLPKLSGLEVLRYIRADARTRRLPVVILTTSQEEPDIAASYDLGVNSYIRKPVDFRQFAAAVEQLGLYWLVLNEAPPKVK